MKKRVVIYCANGLGQRVAYSLDEEEYIVVAVVDSDPTAWGRVVICNMPVQSPDRIKELDYDMVCISNCEYADEIKEMLTKEYGVEESRIMTFDRLIDGRIIPDERIIVAKRCIDILKERGISGSVAEAGVYKGEFAKHLNYYFPDRKIYLFDTFEGFDVNRDDVPDRDKEMFRDTSVDLVLSKMRYPENCVVMKGYFPDTGADIDDSFCLVSLDCDLYEPTINGLEFFYPKLVKGGYIIVHDFGNHYYPDVKRAVYEFCEKSDAVLVPIVDRVLSVIISK